MILSLAVDGAACPLECPTACPLTLWLSTWGPFFGCFGAVYVSDVLPSCDDFPSPNSEASFELQILEEKSYWFKKTENWDKYRKVQQQAFLTWSPLWNHLRHLLETCQNRRYHTNVCTRPPPRSLASVTASAGSAARPYSRMISYTKAVIVTDYLQVLLCMHSAVRMIATSTYRLGYRHRTLLHNLCRTLMTSINLCWWPWIMMTSSRPRSLCETRTTVEYHTAAFLCHL
jgi:hypothetical protein